MTIRRRPTLALLACILAGYGLPSCGGEAVSDTRAHDSEIVAEVGDSILTLTDVERRIPYGISPTDSAALFNSIVDGWVDRLLLEDLGNENSDDLERTNTGENSSSPPIAVRYAPPTAGAFRKTPSEATSAPMRLN